MKLNSHGLVGVVWTYSLLGRVLVSADQCQSDCANELGPNRTLLCYMNEFDQAAVMDSCKLKCEGIFRAEEDQQECLCNYCRYNNDGYLDFCMRPGENQHIEKEDCDVLACTGKAKCMGEAKCKPSNSRWLMSRNEALKRRHVTSKCGLTAIQRKKSGEFECYEHAYLNKTYVLDPCEARVYPERKLSRDQSKCFCNFCKEVDGEYANFCEAPGKGDSIRREECEELVCTGKAKYHGEFCTADDSETAVLHLL